MGDVYSPSEKPGNSESISESPDPRPAVIEHGRIVAVNIRDFTVDVRSEMTFKPDFDIPFMSPYCNQAQGEGINFMPEVGSACWICKPSDRTRSFVLGWIMVQEAGAYRGGRELLNPGDIYLSTRDRNFVAIRRGGIVQVGASKICQRVYLPVRNIIQDFAENYEMHTPAGDLTWEVHRKDEDADGHQGCLYTLSCKEYADDEDSNGRNPLALLKIGSHGDGADTILSLETRNKGGGDIQIALDFSKDGSVTWSVAGDFSQKVEKTYLLDVEGNVSIKSGKKVSIEATEDFSAKGMNATMEAQVAAKVKGTTLNLQADAAATLKAASIALSAPSISLGAAAIWPMMRSSADFILWMTQVTALVNATPGGLATPAVPPTQHFNPQVLG